MRHEKIHHFRVAREAASGQHHAAACVDVRRIAGYARGHTLYARVLTGTYMPLSRGVENDVHARFARDSPSTP